MPDALPTPRQCARMLCGHHGAVNAVHFNAKGTYVMTCGHDKTVRLWNPHRDGIDARGEGLLIKTYQGRHGYDVQDVSIAHDNSVFASCGRDKAVFLWDVPTGQVTRKFDGHEQRVNCVAFNADASVLLSGSYDKTVRAWDIRARNEYRAIQILDDFRDSVTSIVVSEHEIIAGCVDGVVRTFDLRVGTLSRDHIEAPIVSIALSPDQQQLLASSLDGSLRLLDKASGTEVSRYRGHRVQEYQIACAFTSDGGRVVSGSEDGHIYSWDLVDARMEQFTAHRKAVRALAFHPETEMLVTGAEDGSIKVWTSSGSD